MNDKQQRLVDTANALSLAWTEAGDALVAVHGIYADQLLANEEVDPDDVDHELANTDDALLEMLRAYEDFAVAALVAAGTPARRVGTKKWLWRL